MVVTPSLTDSSPVTVSCSPTKPSVTVASLRPGSCWRGGGRVVAPPSPTDTSPSLYSHQLTDPSSGLPCHSSVTETGESEEGIVMSVWLGEERNWTRDRLGLRKANNGLFFWRGGDVKVTMGRLRGGGGVIVVVAPIPNRLQPRHSIPSPQPTTPSQLRY